jgi:hypothetical protein
MSTPTEFAISKILPEPPRAVAPDGTKTIEDWTVEVELDLDCFVDVVFRSFPKRGLEAVCLFHAFS